MPEMDEFNLKLLTESYVLKLNELKELGLSEDKVTKELKKLFTEDELVYIWKEIEKIDDLGKFESEIRKIAWDLTPTSPDRDYKEMIEKFIEDNPLYFDSTAKIFWMWNRIEKKWSMAEDVDVLRRFLNRYQITKWLHPNIQSRMIVALKVIAQNKPEELSPEWIQFKDKLYNLNTNEIMSATPKYFSTNPVNWSVGMTEDTPMIDKLFSEWVDEENVPLLYELIAFCLYREYALNRIFCLLGRGRNGKSSFLRLIEKFLGKENVTNTTLDVLLESRFESGRLLNKLMCIVSELDVGVFRKTSLLKSLTGQDLVRYEFKNKGSSDFKNFAKLIIMGNTLPESSDVSDGFYSRWIIADFPNQFDLEQSRDVVAEIPDVEFENLARKSMRILRELLIHRRFTGEKNIQEKKKEFEEKANLLKIFIESNYEFDYDEFVWKWAFTEKFEEFCRKKNIMAWNNNIVNEKLRKDFGLTIKLKKFTDEKGQERNWWAVFGIREKIKERSSEKGSDGSDGSGTLYSYALRGEGVETPAPPAPSAPSDKKSSSNSEETTENKPVGYPCHKCGRLSNTWTEDFVTKKRLYICMKCAEEGS
jgi:P4 family phage/plasmid primase-like protien